MSELVNLENLVFVKAKSRSRFGQLVVDNGVRYVYLFEANRKVKVSQYRDSSSIIPYADWDEATFAKFERDLSVARSNVAYMNAVANVLVNSAQIDPDQYTCCNDGSCTN